VFYSDGSTDEVDAGTGSTPPPPASLQGTFLGVTGEDVVGPVQESPSGVADWHIRLQGLRTSTVKVRITTSPGGVWESPYGGAFWTNGIRPDGFGNADLWFEPWNNATGIHVKVTYSDGTTDEVDVH